jgi:hypothetical protein
MRRWARRMLQKRAAKEQLCWKGTATFESHTGQVAYFSWKNLNKKMLFINFGCTFGKTLKQPS